MIDERLEDEVMITVIATGFGREEVLPCPTMRSIQSAPEEPASEPRPRRPERPAFTRRYAAAREGAPERIAPRTMMATEEEWDVPTFLRRQGD